MVGRMARALASGYYYATPANTKVFRIKRGKNSKESPKELKGGMGTSVHKNKDGDTIELKRRTRKRRIELSEEKHFNSRKSILIAGQNKENRYEIQSTDKVSVAGLSCGVYMSLRERN